MKYWPKCPVSRWLSRPLCATAIQSNPTQLKQIVWQHTCCVCDLCVPTPTALNARFVVALLVPRKIVILAFIFWGEWEGRQRISSCYRLRPSSEATPMHLGAKTNTQETRHANTHTHTHTPTHSHPLTVAVSIEAHFVLLLRRLYFVCVCLL